MKRLFVYSILILATACAKSGGSNQDSSAPACGAKSLFSAWSGTDNSRSLDLSGFTFASDQIGYLASGGAVCSFKVDVSGNQCAGAYAIKQAALYSGSPDPGCSSLNSSNTYTKNTGSLTLCTAGTTSCSHYE